MAPALPGSEVPSKTTAGQEQQQQQSSRRQSRTTSFSSFTTLDAALRSMSVTPSAPALAWDNNPSTIAPAPTAPPAASPQHHHRRFGSYHSSTYRFAQQQQQRTRCPSSICPHARLDDGGEEAAPLPDCRVPPQPLRPQQHRHLVTAPALLQTQRLCEGSEAAKEEEQGVEANEEDEAEGEARDIFASPRRTTDHGKTGENGGGGEVVGLRRIASEEEQQQLDYRDVVASSNHGRPSYATLTFSSSFSTSSSSSSSSGSSSSTTTVSSSATDSSSSSSSTVTAGKGFSTTTPGDSAAGGGVHRRASAPAAPTLSSSWGSFCPLLARLPSYDEENTPAPESPGTAPNTPGPMHLHLPGSGGVGSRRPYTPSPLTPFPNHSSYFRPLPPTSASSSSYMRSPSPYAHATRRASAMAAPCSPASSSRGRDYMNPDTPPRTPPAAAALMMAALERRRSESAAVLTRKGLESRSCSPVSGSRSLVLQCASCGRRKPEKSRFCCGWPPVHMVLFHGPSGKGWAQESKKKKSSRVSRRSRAVSGGGIE
ncbi:uncharacterized protein J3D65DRAFT_632156 [Phyllosticta citribraziliensis]|uniref:Uncharacterized protein n=1 Tax=Phyllosticta citribraziliensis TaxID=989973 RepID=A0ABR1LH62_9PEZI